MQYFLFFQSFFLTQEEILPYSMIFQSLNVKMNYAMEFSFVPLILIDLSLLS